ncbi:MAG: LCP family protein [Patescibacteria group bacterium]|nr:LCP family protein [Patescibacteria group bacterium]
MKQITLDLDKPSKGKKPEKRLRKKSSVKIGILAIALCVIGTLGFFGHKAYSTLKESGFNINPFAALQNLLTEEQPELKKDENDMTSALIVGLDTRPSEPGLQNTDTVIVATFNHNTNNITMISIPRDMWVEHPKHPGYSTKINGIYNLCEAVEDDTGMECLKDVAETVSNLEIQYYGIIDIAGGVELIDTLGGVDVDIENTFTDYMFPTATGGWEVVSFEEGTQHMDGETAMKFARSRHSMMNSEGTDFARASRQQRLITAVKEKVLSMETYTNPIKIFDLIDSLGKSITVSEITSDDIQAAYNVVQKSDSGATYTTVLNPASGNWTLITEDPSTAYVLFPQAGENNWIDVHSFIASFITNPAMYDESASIYVYNGGLGYNESYNKYLEFVEQYPYLEIVFGGNIGLQTLSDTTVASFSDSMKYATIKEVEDFFQIKHVSDIPEGIANLYGEDIVVVLGTPIQETTNAQN